MLTIALLEGALVMSESSGARRIVGVIIGFFTAMVVVSVVEAIGLRIFLPPADLNLSNAADLQRLIETMPAAGKSMVLAAWFLGAFIGGWVALIITRWRLSPWIICVVIIGGGIWSMVMIPHPLWMMVAGLVLPVLAAMLVLRRNRITPHVADTFV